MLADNEKQLGDLVTHSSCLLYDSVNLLAIDIESCPKALLSFGGCEGVSSFHNKFPPNFLAVASNV